MRSCSNGVFKRSGQIGRPCLLGYIDKCSAPCVGRVDADEHREIAEDFADFMGGRTDAFVKRIEREMYAASEAQDYEKAARLRDDLGALHKALEKQAVVFGDGTDADVIALAEDPLEVAVQIFHVRAGRIRGQRGWVADRVEDLDTSGPGRRVPAAALRRRGRRRDPARDPRAGHARGRRDLRAAALARAGAAGSRSGCRSAGTSVPCRRPSRRTPRSPWPCTRPSGPAT